MPLRKIFGLVFLILTAVCLAAGYAPVGQRAVLAIILTTLLIWLLAYKWPSSGLPQAALFISIGLASAGLFAGAMPLLMMLGVTLALVAWDLALLDQTLTNSAPGEMVALLEKKHFESLALVFGLGLLGVTASRMIRFQIPFGVLVLLAGLTLFSLDRVWRTLVVDMRNNLKK